MWGDPPHVTSPFWGPPCPCKQALEQRRRRGQRERHKSNRFGLAKQQLCTCITLFCTFLCRHCTTTTWKCLISSFEEDVNRRQRLSFSFPVLWSSVLELNSREVCQHWTNWTRWNKHVKVWGSVNSLFKGCFRSRRRRSCLGSLIIRENAMSLISSNNLLPNPPSFFLPPNPLPLPSPFDAYYAGRLSSQGPSCSKVHG